MQQFVDRYKRELSAALAFAVLVIVVGGDTVVFRRGESARPRDE